MKRILILAVASLLFSNGWAQYTLKGLVKNAASGIVLSGAHVQISNTHIGVVSDSDGFFSIPDLSKGSYLLTISFLGFEPETRQINLETNMIVTIAMKTSAILQDEVIIQSTRVPVKSPLTYQDIDRQELESINLGQDLPLLLSGSLSAVSTSDAGNGMGYTALRIRGSDMTRINVTMNGVPLNDPESHNVFWVDLPDVASSTQSIQIQRGVGTSTNGAAAFGASINLLTNKLMQEPYGEIASSYGSFRSSKLSASFGTGLLRQHWTLDGRFSTLASDGFIDRASSNLSSFHVSTGYSGKNSILRFNLISGNEKTYQAWDGIPGKILDTNRRYNGIGAYYDQRGTLKYYANETDNYRQTHYQLFFSRQVNNSLIINTSAHYTKGAGYYEQYRDDDDCTKYGIAPVRIPGNYYLTGADTIHQPDSTIQFFDIIRRKWLDNDFAGLTYSLSWRKNRYHTTFGGSWNTYTGRHFGKIIWSEFSSNIGPDYEWYRSRALKRDFNVYGKTTIELSKRVSIYIDMQIRSIKYGINGIDDDSRNISQDHDFTFFNPKAGLYCNLDEFNTAYFSFGRAKREPNRDNFVDANPSKPFPSPETLYNFETGHSLRKSRLLVNSNIYLMYYRDQLALTGAINDVGAPVMENVQESYRIGLELIVNLDIHKLLQWNLSATISRNKISRFTEYIDNWDNWEQIIVEHRNTDLSFSPSILANSELVLRLPKEGRLSLVSKFIDRQYIDNTQDKSRSLDPYFINDIRLSYIFRPTFCKEIGINILISNVLNHEYESNAWIYRYWEGSEFKKLDGFFPQAGIHFLSGISIKF